MSKPNSFMSGSRSYALINQTSCREHQGELYTNFCSSPTCVKPLCPECVESHYDFHKQMGSKPQMESFKTVKQRCHKKLRQLLDALAKEGENYGIARDIDMSKIFESSLRKIKDAKQAVDRAVKQFFIQLEDNTRKKMSYFMSDRSQLTEKMDKCDKIVGELENMLKALEVPAQFLETVEKTIRLEGNRLVTKMAEDYDQIQRMRSQFQISVNIDKGLPQSINSLLSQSIILGQVSGSLERQFTQNINTFIRQSPRHTDFRDTESQYTSMSKKNRQSKERERQRERQKDDIRSVRSNIRRDESFENRSVKRQRSSSAQRPARPINIIGMNTFKEESERKYLHFFQNDENCLHLLDLGLGSQFKAVKLDIGFRIPFFHKSISTPNGDLYLIGGSIPNSTVKSQKIYKYDFQNKTLNYCTSLKNGRSSHALCFNNRYIYIVGGFLNNQIITNKCQRYDLNTNKVEQIEPCVHPVNSLCLASFNGRYIFKFGGINPNQQISHFIEKFDEKTQKWKVLNPVFEGRTRDFALLSTSAACQITQNQIMVLGGYDQRNQGYNQTYFFQIEGQDCTIKDVNMYPLPTAEGFWNNTPIIHNKKVYALQNITSSNKEDCVENNRTILQFDGRAWRVLN